MEKELLSQENTESSKKQKRFWIFLLLSAGIVLGGLYGFLLFLQRPAIGDIRVNTVVTERTDEGKGTKEYRGKYLVFSYPEAYLEKTHTFPVKGPIKESIFLSADTLGGEKIAIVVEERLGGDFEASPGFQMRVNKPKEYEKEAVSLSGYKGVLFRKNTVVFERTFFLQDGDFVVTFSVTSPLGGDTLEQDLSVLLDSLRFLE